MKKLIFILILTSFVPFKAHAYPVSFTVSVWGYPTVSSYRYSPWRYMGFGFPYWGYTYYHPNVSEGIRLVKAEMAATNQLAAMGEAQRAAWENGEIPHPILPPPAPVPPEPLTAPDITIQKAE